MRILILTVTAGHGHNATAKAASDALKSQEGVEVLTLDIYKYLNKFVHDTIEKGYLFSTKYTPDIYRFFYMLIENRGSDREKFFSDKVNIIRLVNILGALKFDKFITDFCPDKIVCTHTFAANLINEMSNRQLIDIPYIGIITDYTIHPLWNNCNMIDTIITASPLLTNEALRKGIDKHKVLPIGIPIDKKFSKSISKEKALIELGLSPHKDTILIMGGSMGHSRGEKIAQEIIELGFDVQIIAVCGNNSVQYRKLDRYKNKNSMDNLHIYDFVDNVDIMMDAADCIITKPGGLTITEALAKKLPLILTSPIPGQEERNAEFLLNNGIALLITKTFTLSDALYYLFRNPNRIASINQNIDYVYPENWEINFIKHITKTGL